MDQNYTNFCLVFILFYFFVIFFKNSVEMLKLKIDYRVTGNGTINLMRKFLSLC